ncbi:Pleckstrin homology-like domain [Plasmopara halstedii]|uniref:Pleckstrin homology-like domain n=1 Tax=Plasmopara halstedii TaxID=4781 RepID=A0A0P1AWS2_PLAHL|nr:Pleckstrin homology-like domain [Plasmopara halstedii]CEG45857.1 Pleckstrin homology-like domain [Plasmopara halstedii]|eukprot:XP_024582226.1 Pleckstrin homology-like domain [Plasmopara halstedii]
MDVYLIKRGHKFPSMRKNYCVLVRIELSFYVTHDESKNRNSSATTNRLDAMELETKDGKTFFCAASSAKDKRKWINTLYHEIAPGQRHQRCEMDNASETEHDRRLEINFAAK